MMIAQRRAWFVTAQGGRCVLHFNSVERLEAYPTLG